MNIFYYTYLLNFFIRALGDKARIRAARPLCILSATGAPGPEHVQHSMLVVGSGNGADVESAAPIPVANKNVKTRRPKTARPRRNRQVF